MIAGPIDFLFDLSTILVGVDTSLLCSNADVEMIVNAPEMVA